MSNVKAINIEIERDPMTKIPKLVWPWEVPIFREQYGDEKVVVIGEPVVVQGAELPDAAEEYMRLRQQFGIHADTRESLADRVYGRGQDGIDKLEKAIKASAASGDVEAAQKVVDPKKVEQAQLDKRAEAVRDPLEQELIDQDDMSMIGKSAGGPGDVSGQAGPKPAK